MGSASEAKDEGCQEYSILLGDSFSIFLLGNLKREKMLNCSLMENVPSHDIITEFDRLKM